MSSTPSDAPEDTPPGAGTSLQQELADFRAAAERRATQAKALREELAGVREQMEGGITVPQETPSGPGETSAAPRPERARGLRRWLARR